MVNAKPNHHHRRAWDANQTVELLAYLDYCIEHPEVIFNTSIENHLKNTTGITRNLTRSVRPQLARLRLKYAASTDTFRKFTQLGTSCLKLPEDLRLKIEQAKNRIQAHPHPGHPERITTDSDSQESHSSDHDEQTRIRSTSDAQTTQSERNSSLSDGYAQLQDRNQRLEMDKRQLEERKGQLVESMRQLEEKNKQLEEKIQQVSARYADLREASHSENAYLKKTIEILKKLRTPVPEMAAYHHGVGVKTWENFAWLDDLIDKACLSLTRSDAHSNATEAGSSWTSTLLQLMNRIMGTGEIGAIRSSARGTELSELEILGKFVERRQLRRRDVLRSLVSAYISAFVFETPFPAVFGVDMSLQGLLDNYRRYVLLQDGSKALKNMDFLAHETWMAEQKFDTEIVFVKSQKLAADLDKVLAPVLQSNIIGEEPHHFDMVSERPAAAFLQPVFTEALRLKTQLLLAGKQYRMEFYPPGTPSDRETMKRHGYSGSVINHIGASFSMAQDMDGKEVKICLFPAVWTYHKPPPPPEQLDGDLDASVKREVVNYHNFSQEEDEVSLYPIIAARAIVSLSPS